MKKIKEFFINNKKRLIVSSVIILIILIGGFVSYNIYINNTYNNKISLAEKKFNTDKFNEAKTYYEGALKYKNDSSIQDKIELCDELDKSQKSFNSGNKSFGNKDYKNAYEEFKNVIEEDKKRYKTAQIKEKECAKLYASDMIQSAKNLEGQKNYTGAISNLKELISINDNNDTANALLTQYKKEQQSQVDEQNAAEQLKEQQDACKNARSIIIVKSVTTSQPNSAEGVDLHIVWTNESSKTIKYVSFKVTPYNAVGDPVSSEIGDSSDFKAEVTGPINSGATYGDGRVWENAWYNSSIVNAKINQIDITYMDGSTATIDSNSVGYVQN